MIKFLLHVTINDSEFFIFKYHWKNTCYQRWISSASWPPSEQTTKVGGPSYYKFLPSYNNLFSTNNELVSNK